MITMLVRILKPSFTFLPPQIKYKENFEKEKGKPCAITTDTPLNRRIKKVQDQLSEVSGWTLKANHRIIEY